MEPHNAHTNSLHRTLQTVCSGAVLDGLEARPEPNAFPEPAPVTLLLCTRGRYEHLNSRGGWYFVPGDLVLLRCEPHTLPPEFHAGHFAGTALELRTQMMKAAPQSPVSRLLTGRDPVLRIRTDTDALRRALASAESAKEAVRWLCDPKPGDATEPMQGVALSQVRIAKGAFAMLWENCSRHIPIGTLAEALNVSTTHLKNSFRAVYGAPLYSYVRTQKMLAAAGQLRYSGHTVLDIAGEFGYDNGSKFARAFRTVMGMTPREFRSNDGVQIESVQGERQVLPHTSQGLAVQAGF